MSTNFRTAVDATPAQAENTTHVQEAKHSGDVIEVPHSEYRKEHPYPFAADYFDLGDRWADREGGYPEEVEVIENYISQKIESGEYPNTTDAIKTRLRSIEKLTGLEKDERIPIRIETLAAYMKFMDQKELIRLKTAYGAHQGR